MRLRYEHNVPLRDGSNHFAMSSVACVRRCRRSRNALKVVIVPAAGGIGDFGGWGCVVRVARSSCAAESKSGRRTKNAKRPAHSNSGHRANRLRAYTHTWHRVNMSLLTDYVRVAFAGWLGTRLAGGISSGRQQQQQQQ